MTPFEVVVIGGSLAGSASAFALAARGVRVLVIDKARFPRPKMCGEFLSAEAHPVLARMGALDELKGRGAEVISRFSAVRADGRGASAPLPEPVLSISREVLDTVVAAKAEGAGAAFHLDETVTAVSGDLANGFEVRTNKGGYRARCVIGAWGRYSPLDGKLGRAFFGSPATLFGFTKHLEGDSGFLKGRVVLHLFDGGYLGLSPIEGGLVNLASLTIPRIAKEAHHDLDHLLRSLEAKSEALASDLATLQPKPGPVVLSEPVHLGPRDPVARDVLLTGDAAGVLDPYTGTGMAAALLTGEAAAGPVSEFLAGGLGREALVAEHRRTYRAIMGRRFFYSKLFRPAFFSELASRMLLPVAVPVARLGVRLTRLRS